MTDITAKEDLDETAEAAGTDEGADRTDGSADKGKPSLDLAPMLARLHLDRLQVALAVLVVVAGGVLAWPLLQAPEDKPSRPVAKASGAYHPGSVPAGQEALEVATKTLPAALTYDYRELDESLEAATRSMTPAFAKEFSGTYHDTVGKLAAQKQAVTKAIVRGGGVLSTDDEKATTLLFVDQVLVTSNSSKNSAPVVVAQSRVVVELRKNGSTWQVSDLKPF
ncbi:hypothetical protein ABTX24_26235 [Nocardioides sp. NPDC127514]|uniref:hypothetical protein n=1 Tax=unclassified Nocardioides TaxID=2615069 RepID=UPI0033211238